MIDPINPLEEELRQFSPASPSAGLHERVAAAMNSQVSDDLRSDVGRSRADRFLLGYISIAAAAGVLVVTIFAIDLSSSDGGSVSSSVQSATDSRTQMRNMLAQLAVGDDPVIPHTRQ